MKLVRPILFTLGGILLLLAALVALALVPAVQGWAVKRALAGQPGLQLEFARIAAGPSRAELTDVTFARDGLRVRVARAEATYSLWSVLFANRLSISRLAADGVEVDASKLTETESRGAAAGGPAAAPGALTQVRLPWQLELGELRVLGRALLPGAAGQTPLPAEFEFTGGGIAPEKEGKISFKIQVADKAADARVTALRTVGELRIHQTPQQTFDRAALALTVDAEGPQLAQPTQLRLAADVGSRDQSTTYVLKVDTVRSGTAENLLHLEAVAPLNEPLFSGRWSVQAERAQLEPFFLGGALPNFSLRGSGTYRFRADNAAVAVQGEVLGQVSALEVLDPALRALGAIKLDARFDAAAEPGVLRIEHLSGRIDNDRPIAAFEIKRAVSYQARTQQVQIAAGASEVGRIQLHGLPLAWVRPFVSAVDVSGGVISGEFVVNGDAHQLAVESIAPLRVTNLSVVQAGKLLLDRAEIASGLSGSLQPTRATARLREFTLRTPAGDSVRVDLAVETPLGQPPALSVQFRSESDLPQLLAPFVLLGHVRNRSEADFTVSPTRLDVRSYRTEVALGRQGKLVEVSAVRPFSFDLRSFQVVPVAGAEEVEIGRIAYERVVLADLAFLQEKLPLSGELAAGGFVASAKGTRLQLRATSPVRVSNLVLQQVGRRVLDGVAVQTSPALDFGGLADWRISDGATLVQDRAGAALAELNLEASAGAEGLRANANFNADLALLGSQPLLASLHALSAGRASGELRAGFAGGLAQIEARSTMNGLVAREGNQTLPVANLSLRFTRATDGRMTLEMPLLLDRLGQRSDLRIEASAAPQAGGLRFEARVASDNLELADALAVSALASGSADSATPAAPAPAARTSATRAAAGPRAVPAAAAPVVPTQPAWAGVQGEVTVALKRVVRGNAWAMSDFSAVARVEPNAVRLEKVAGTINERGALSGRGELAFAPSPKPYALQGEFSLTEFDVGALLKALEAGERPTLEGIFSVNGKVAGTGVSVDEVLTRARGNFELQSRKGVFRGLRRTSDKVSVATKAVDAVAALGSLFGSDKVKQAAGKVAGQTYQVDQLAQALAELEFDQFVIRANRDDALNLRIEEISLLSPEVRLNARGAVNHVEGKPLLEQPLTLSYQLGARGKVEQMLGRLRALDGTKDDLGYSKAKDLGQITGTLSRPVPNELFLRLAESKLGDFLN